MKGKEKRRKGENTEVFVTLSQAKVYQATKSMKYTHLQKNTFTKIDNACSSNNSLMKMEKKN